MGDKRYIISDASKMLKVESHVLRYWEEELDISIPRNEMGHRYYTENHINLLKNVRDLKEQGYGLRTIKLMITEPQDMKKLPELTHNNGVSNNKMEQFQEIMGNIVTRALEKSTENIVTKTIEKTTGEAVAKALNDSAANMTRDVSDKISEKVLKEMDYIMRMQDEKEEERYKRLDEAIRNKQKNKEKDKKLLKKFNKKEKKLQKKQKQKISRTILDKKTQTI